MTSEDALVRLQENGFEVLACHTKGSSEFMSFGCGLVLMFYGRGDFEFRSSPGVCHGVWPEKWNFLFWPSGWPDVDCNLVDSVNMKDPPCSTEIVSFEEVISVIRRMLS